MTRTFIAIELTDQAREALRREIARLRAALPSVRFADPAGLHLTLTFLGELDEARLAEAIAATEDVALATSPFALSIAGIGTFGGAKAPRVIWAGVVGDIAVLLAVQSHLARALEARGFVLEARPFAPHLTLARLKNRPDAEASRQLAALVRAAPNSAGTTLPVAALSVMKSELRPDGARYTRLREVPLGGPRPSR